MIFKQLIQIIEQVLPDIEIEWQLVTPDFNLNDTLLLDSITILLLGIAIEEQFKVNLSTTDLFSCVTIGDVIDVIKSYQQTS